MVEWGWRFVLRVATVAFQRRYTSLVTEDILPWPQKISSAAIEDIFFLETVFFRCRKGNINCCWMRYGPKVSHPSPGLSAARSLPEVVTFANVDIISLQSWNRASKHRRIWYIPTASFVCLKWIFLPVPLQKSVLIALFFTSA